MRVAKSNAVGWLLLLVVSLPAMAENGREEAEELEQASANEGPTLREIESSNLDSDLSPGEATTVTTTELDEIYAPDQEGYLEETGIRSPLLYLTDPLEDLYQKTGLRLGVANTMLFLQPMGGQSSRSGSAGDLDFMSSWTLLGRGSENPGRLVFTGEYRYAIGSQPSSDVGPKEGTIVAPTNAFNARGWVIRDAYWIQRFFDGRLRVLFGRADISDYMGAHWLQNVNNSFINRNFSANAAIPFPGHGPMLGFSIRPTDQFYLTAGAVNAYSLTTDAGIDTVFDEGDFFSMAEVGYTPTFEPLGEGRYAFGLWHMDARGRDGLPSSYGFTFIADQNLTPNLQAFARYSYNDGRILNIKHNGQIGLGYSGLLGRTNDLTGAAFALTVPQRTTSRNETALEIFHRFQVAANTQFTTGFQIIANPGNAVENEPVGMFYVRLRTSF